MGRYDNRATQPLHPAIRDALTRNLVNGLYQIKEGGVLYSMELEMVRNLSGYFKGFVTGLGQHYPTIERWYSDLSNTLKKQVTRTGNVKREFDGFYPDLDYSD